MAENQENDFVSAVEDNRETIEPNSVAETQEEDISAEKTLKRMANFILLVGISAAIICLFTICWVEVPKAGYSYITEKVFSGGGFATTVGILVGSLSIWAIFKVIANISITLKDINKKIK